MNYAQFDSFQAIADINRRNILKLLAERKQSINSIAENFKISRPAISKHIKVLESTGFLTIEQNGRERICVLNQKGFEEVQLWIDFFESYWKDQLQSLDRFLKNEQSKMVDKSKNSPNN